MKTAVRIKSLKSSLLLIIVSMASLAFGQQGDCKGKFGKDSAMDVRNISMFNQYIQQKDYTSAFPYWNYLLNNIPCYSKHITYYGPTIIKYKMKELRDENDSLYQLRKDGLIDTVFLSYQLRIKFWGQEGYVLGKLANEMASLRPNDRKSAIDTFAKSFEMEGNNSDDLFPLYYLDAVIDEHRKDRYSLDSLYDLYFKLQKVVDYNLENNEKKKDDWVRTDTTLAKMIQPFLTCENVTNYYKPLTDSLPSPELYTKVASMLAKAGCLQSEYFSEIAIELYKIKPSSEAAINIAKSFHAKSEFRKAKEYYIKGVDGIKDNIEKSNVYFSVANIEYSNGNCVSAKNYAQNALEANPNHGNAHLIIAYCYAKSSGSATADLIDGRSVFWAAVDRAIKAKTVDPSVAEKANQMIASYSSSFVTKEDAFFKGFTVPEGGSYTVPGLGIPTTVRYKN